MRFREDITPSATHTLETRTRKLLFADNQETPGEIRNY